MKLRLPIQLFRALMVLAGTVTAQAAIMHSAVLYNTYVDFASNAGRFAVGTTNELLEYIRERDNGVRIEYISGETSAALPHGMISFDSVADMGNGTLINYNYLVTVKHNGTLDPTFGANKYGVGPGNELKYKGIEVEGSSGSFVMDSTDPNADYKLIRLSKLVTDATSANLYYPAVKDGKTQVDSQLVYRVGGGNHQVKGVNGEVVAEYDGGGYNVGGIGYLISWENIKINDPTYPGVYSEVQGKESWALNGFSANTPLPFGSQGGDSGSPYFAWNENAETPGFELLMVHRGSANSGEKMYADADPYWTRDEAIEQQSVRVDMGIVTGTLKINGTATQPAEDGEQKDTTLQGWEVIAKPYRGILQDDVGDLVYDKVNNVKVTFNGVESGLHTWKSLTELKNNSDWYTYGDKYLNAGDSWILDGKDYVTNPGITLAELYQTQNLVFEAAADKVIYNINVTADTDLGVGYIQFSAGKYCDVGYNVMSEKSNLLDSAGYVVDAGVQVNVSLRNWNPEEMREWRKVGEGTLNICGKNGNNEIFLNVGGTGETLLNQSDGYAAYNVLVNTGSTVRIKDTSQIHRDLTFGNGGGVLDMNGNTMDWYTKNGEDRTGVFTINALTEEAIITNSSADHAALIYKQDGDTRFVGSFRDSNDSSLGITYSVEGGTWELNSIRTSLTHKNSGLTVEKGTVKLAGTLTAHGHGSLLDDNGRPVYDTDGHALFATRDNDWHYADAKMNVTVKDGAAFELESHARLTGTVTVETGGSYIMHEGVQHEYEYIEGGVNQESTAEIADYYGHKGDVKLEGTGMLTWMRGDKEVATLRTNSAGTAEMSKVESTISSETELQLKAAEGKAGRIASAVMSLQKNVSVELCELYLDSSSAITSADGATVSMQETTLALGSGNTTLTSTTLDSALTLSMSGNTDIQMQLADGTAVLDVESTALSGSLTLTGTDMVLDFTELTTPVDGWVRVHFGENVKFADTEKLTVTALTATGGAVGYFAPADVGFVYFNIPEPATTSLSLFALVALAARRRRK